MRTIPLAFLMLAMTAGTAFAVDEFPYTAYVTAADVHVRSGPGQNYYPTSMLPRGAAVEVYRHDPGGWYAIRPPEGSFSWISARFLEIGSEGIATVAGDRVVARVGSELSDVRDVIQVRLDKGEQLELVEDKIAAPGQAPAAWYKVAAPAGEFRWVHAKYLDSQRPSATQARRGDRNLLLAKQRLTADDAGAGEAANKPDERDELDNFRPLKEKQVRDKQEASQPALPALAQAADLDELDLLLSKMIIEEPEEWNLREVRAQAEGFVESASTKAQRDRGKEFLAKVDRFERIQDGALRQPLGAASAVARRSPSPATTKLVPIAANESAGFDGAGQLRTVVSRRPNAPQFALVDDSGAVRSFVAAAPGVNLRPYVGQQVGIIGIRGTAPEMNAPMLTARQITPLERTARR